MCMLAAELSYVLSWWYYSFYRIARALAITLALWCKSLCVCTGTLLSRTVLILELQVMAAQMLTTRCKEQNNKEFS